MLQAADEHLRPHELDRVTAVGEAPGHPVQPPFHVVLDAGEGQEPLLTVLFLLVGELKDRVDEVAALAAHRVGQHPPTYADLRRGQPGALRTLLLTCLLAGGFLGFGSLDGFADIVADGPAVVPGAWRAAGAGFRCAGQIGQANAQPSRKGRPCWRKRAGRLAGVVGGGGRGRLEQQCKRRARGDRAAGQ
jgi:hypothetical protein